VEDDPAPDVLAAMMAQAALPHQMLDGAVMPTLPVAQIEALGQEDQLLGNKMLLVDMPTNTFDMLTFA